jgi:hypothetical protein
MRKADIVSWPLALVLLCGCATNGIPRDVQAFVKKRDACDHFRGEVPDPGPNQKERMKEVAEEIEKFCTGTDAELGKLRVRYRKDSAVMERLAGYDSLIEGSKQ